MRTHFTRISKRSANGKVILHKCRQVFMSVNGRSIHFATQFVLLTSIGSTAAIRKFLTTTGCVPSNLRCAHLKSNKERKATAHTLFSVLLHGPQMVCRWQASVTR